jgi:hypothetical protein
MIAEHKNLNYAIELGTEKYNPVRAFSVRHHLEKHPLLEFSSLIELAKRVKKPAFVNWFHSEASAGQVLGDLFRTHGDGSSLEAAFEYIHKEGTWIGFHYIQHDPIVRELLESCLNTIAPVIESVDPGVCQIVGFIFLSGPGAVTPYHMDPDHGFLLQIHGSKKVRVWNPNDHSVVPPKAIEEFLTSSPREAFRYKEEFEAKAQTFELKPGEGVYIPWSAPHWVSVNDDDYSVSINLSFRTRETERKRRIHMTNHYLRRLKIDPAPPGLSETRDALKCFTYQTKELVSKALGR